jgi:hypothetical protein
LNRESAYNRSIHVNATQLASNPDVRIGGRECLESRVSATEWEKSGEEASIGGSTSRKRKLPEEADEYEVDKILAVWFDVRKYRATKCFPKVSN